MSLEILPDLVLPNDVSGAIGVATLQCLLSKDSPAERCQHARSRPAEWLSDPRLAGHGVYLWLRDRCGGGHQYFHVGKSGSGASTLSKRTRTHVNKAYETDKVLTFNRVETDRGFERLSVVCADCDGSKRCAHAMHAASDFLSSVRILFLKLPGSLSAACRADAAASLEWAIDRVAKLGGWRLSQTTNDAHPSNPCRLSDQQALALGNCLNDLVPMFPPLDVQQQWAAIDPAANRQASCRESCRLSAKSR